MRTKVMATMLGVVMALGASAPAYAKELAATAQPYLTQFENSSREVRCQGSPEYEPSNPAMFRPEQKSACVACQKQLDALAQNLPGQIQAAVAQNNSAASGSSLGIGNVLGGLTGTQNNAQGTTTGAAATGAAGSMARATASEAASAAFGNCASQLSSCNNMGIHQSFADQAKKACTEGAAATKGVATEQAAKGMTMSEMAQMAGSAGQLLGPLAQMMQGGQKGSGSGDSGVSGSNTGLSPYSYTPSSGLSDGDDSTTTSTTAKNTPQTSPTANTKLGGSDKTAGSTVSMENKPSSAGSGFYTSPNSKSAGSGSGDTAYNSVTADPSKLSDSLGSGSSFGSNGQGYGASLAGGGGSVGALGGSGNSSGASRMGDKDAAAKAAGEVGAFELPGGGSGSRPAFLGLKGGGLTDLSAGAEGALPPGAEGLESLGADLGEEGGRELASQANDIHAEGDASIFHLVKAKYVEIKKRGNI